MIVAFSTSSPFASVALIGEDGTVLDSAAEESHRAAGAVCLRLLSRLLTETGLTLGDARLFAADLGPGSFTGVRVGVALAQSMAFAKGVLTIGATSFDLISTTETVFVPTRKGEFLVREPGEQPVHHSGLPSAGTGYGSLVESPTYPDANRFALLAADLTPVEPHLLLPAYLVGPSISQPKRPYGIQGVDHG